MAAFRSDAVLKRTIDVNHSEALKYFRAGRGRRERRAARVKAREMMKDADGR